MSEVRLGHSDQINQMITLTVITIGSVHLSCFESKTLPFKENKFKFYSLNYGAMGVVMGHELSHAFDDQVIRLPSSTQ
jgi:hypothetical protein